MKKIRGNKMKKQISKKCSLIVLVTLGLILSGLFSGFAFRPANAAVIQFNEFQITSNPASQINPDISGTNIVYQDNRNGNWHIYLYQLEGAFVDTRIGTSLANQINPKISGDKIVYQDDRNGNWDIYMYDLTTQIETHITNNASSQESPAIDGNRIVWNDNRNGNWDIYMFDLSTNSETRLTTSGSNTCPAISGDRIAYIKDGDVYYFDLSSGTEFSLTAYDGYLEKRDTAHTAISDRRVVWDVEHLYGAGYLYPHYEWTIYMRDVVTGAAWDTTALTQAGGEYNTPRIRPHISELYTGVYYIVYQKYWPLYGQQWDIYLYNTDTQALYQVTDNMANQENPRVSGGRIVYQDDRNGNWDIYMTMVSYIAGDPTPPTPAAAIQKIEAIEDIIADPAQIPTSDMDGANIKVRENRREALLKKLDAVIASIQAAADSTGPADRTANYQNAMDQLNSILDKTDGCALRGTPDTKGTGFTPDWIITCGSQELIDPLIRSSLTMLQALLEQGAD
jgi:beta propeller repeat protein